MATLPTNSFASPGNPFYAAIGSGGGGGGGGSTLQSPASIIPAANGSVQLGLPATGAAVSNILLSGTTQLNVNFLRAGTEGYITGMVDPDGSYEISSGGAPTPALQYFAETTRNLSLGDGGNGIVLIRNALQVQDTVTSATNGINIEVTGDTTASIYQSSGASVLSLGASNTHKDIIQLADNAGIVPGAYIFGQSTGGSKSNPILISGGAQGSTPNSIYSGVANTGTLALGSSAAVPNSIVMTDASTIIRNQAPPVGASTLCSINGSTTVIPVGTYRIDPPAGVTFTTGIWWFALNAQGTSNSQFQVNTLVYYNSAANSGLGGFTTGGAAVSNTDGNGHTVILYPQNAFPYMTISFNGATSFGGYMTATPLFLATVAGLG